MKQVLTVQDLSCLGKCSLTVALPVLSAMGCSTSVLPTAVLSTHTAFPKPHVRDLTGDMAAITSHWNTIGAKFDGILVGYLSDPAQVKAVGDLWDSFPALRILDPAMGDHGAFYSGITNAHVAAMKSLSRLADLLLPNVTEACLLTDTPYEASPDEGWYWQVAEKLLALGCKQAVLTGVSLQPGKTGFLCSNGGVYQTDALPGSYHGTGDLFAAVLTGGLMQGCPLQTAAEKAAKYVEKTIAATGAASSFGIAFEQHLSSLTGR